MYLVRSSFIYFYNGHHMRWTLLDCLIWKRCCASAFLSLSIMLQVIVMFFFRAEASDALLPELFLEFQGVFLVYFTAFFHIVNYFFSLLICIASPYKIYYIRHVMIEPFGCCSFFSVFLSSPYRVNLNLVVFHLQLFG